jgi:glycosyltransferase involved in cell wall biosynthesis
MKHSNKKLLYIIANAALGKGLSGSDRIFIELAKHLRIDFNVHICVWEEGFEMCQRQNLKDVFFENWNLGVLKNIPFILNYFIRIFTGILYSFKINLKKEEVAKTIFYCASDFWQDFIPFIILKLRYPKAIFIGTFYLAAPNPIFGFRKQYEKYIQFPSLKDFFYYLQQFLPKLLLTKISDYIFVTSDPDKEYFIKKRFKKENLFSIMGGVNFENYKNVSNDIEKSYDGIFYGRFHPQKGVLELLDIWKILLKNKPNAKLLMIGDGPLFYEVKDRISKNNLNDHIELVGHLDDSPKKLELFSKSKIVVHPAVYDSGGMAAAEIMYLRIPGVSFDLEALKTYYPKGMLKTKCFDLQQFAENINKLLDNDDLYKKLSTEAKECVEINFDWNKKAEFIRRIFHEKKF